MKLKKARIVIQPAHQTRTEWIGALEGRVRSLPPQNTLFFSSLAAVAKVFSPARLQLLGAILRSSPESIYELAKTVKRDFKNVHADVKLLAKIGFLELQSSHGKRGAVRPVPKYRGFEIDLAA